MRIGDIIEIGTRVPAWTPKPCTHTPPKSTPQRPTAPKPEPQKEPALNEDN
jgi:hypothetical protein